MKKPSFLNILIFSIAVVFVFLAYFMQTVLASTSDHFINVINISSSTVVMLSSLFFIIYGVMQIPVGVLIDRYGIQLLLPVSIGITLVGTILFWLTSSPKALLISRTIEGLGTCSAYVIALFIASNFFRQKYFVVMIAAIEMISMLGDVLATEAYGRFIYSVGWDTANLTVVIVVIILLAASIYSSLAQRTVVNTEVKIKMKKVAQNTLSLFANKSLLLLLGYVFFTWAAIMSMAGYWAKDYFSIIHEYSFQDSLRLMEVYWVGLFIGCPVIGFLASKFGNIAKILIALAISNTALQIVLAQPEIFNFSALIAITFLIGFMSSGVILAFSVLSKIVPSHQESTASSILNMGIIFGGLFGQIIFGKIVSNLNITEFVPIYSPQGNYYTALLISPFSAILASVAAIIIYKKLNT